MKLHRFYKLKKKSKQFSFDQSDSGFSLEQCTYLTPILQ